MVHKADDWDYIETCFGLWKCHNCNYHFAVEVGNICEEETFKCPVCAWGHSYQEKVEYFEVVIDYYSGGR